MPIRYHLVENRLTPSPNDYYAKVTPIATIDLEGLSRRIREQGSVLSEADILATLQSMVTAIEGALGEGYRVNFGDLVRFSPSISGVFEGIGESFDPSRHAVNLNAMPGLRLRGALANVSVEKIRVPNNNPILDSFEDTGFSMTNLRVTPGNIGTILGDNLRINKENADEGIFFVSLANGEQEIKVSSLQRNKPGQLIFLNPLLKAGQYRLEVRNRINGKGDLMIGALSANLEVVLTD